MGRVIMTTNRQRQSRCLTAVTGLSLRPCRTSILPKIIQYSTVAQKDIRQVRDRIVITDGQFDELVAKGLIKPRNVAVENVARAAQTDEIMALAHTVTIQFSTDRRREITYTDYNLFECIEPPVDVHYPYGGNGDDEPIMIMLPYEGYRRTVFFNRDMLDYISFPISRIERDKFANYDR